MRFKAARCSITSLTVYISHSTLIPSTTPLLDVTWQPIHSCESCSSSTHWEGQKYQFWLYVVGLVQYHINTLLWDCAVLVSLHCKTALKTPHKAVEKKHVWFLLFKNSWPCQRYISSVTYKLWDILDHFLQCITLPTTTGAVIILALVQVWCRWFSMFHSIVSLKTICT